MPTTLEDWKDRYFEQQALHTEARGMIGAERDRLQARADLLAEQLQILHETLLTGAGAECYRQHERFRVVTELLRPIYPDRHPLHMERGCRD